MELGSSLRNMQPGERVVITLRQDQRDKLGLVLGHWRAAVVEEAGLPGGIVRIVAQKG